MKNIDNFFRESLGNYTEVPPQSAWNGIQKKLGSTKPSIVKFPIKFISYFFVASVVVGVTVYVASKAVQKNNNYTKSSIEKPNANNLASAPIVANNTTNNKSLQTLHEINAPNGTDNNSNNFANNTSAKHSSANAMEVSSVASVHESKIKDNKLATNTSTSVHKIAKTEIKPKQHSNVSTLEKSSRTHKIKHQILSGNLTTIEKKPQPAKSKNKIATNSNIKKNSESKKIQNIEKPTAQPTTEKSEQVNNEVLNTATSAREKDALNDLQNLSTKNEVKPNAYFGTSEVKYSPENGLTSDSCIEEPILTFDFKQPLPVNAIDKLNKSDKNKKASILDKFELNFLSGYEFSNNANTAKNLVFSPSIQYNVSNILSFSLQPAIKWGNVPVLNLGAFSYYQLHDDATVAFSDSATATTISIDSVVTTTTVKNYKYTQTHDSIVKSYRTQGKPITFELRIMAEYKMLKNLSFIGGINLNFYQPLKIIESTSNFNGLAQTGTASTTTVTSTNYATYPPTATTTSTALPPMDNILKYPGTPYSQYNGPLYTASGNATSIKLGWVVGLKYELKQRLLFELMAQPSLSKPEIINGSNVNNSLNSLYWRFMVGYKLMKSKPKN